MADIRNYKIVVDPGHGGHDSGALGAKTTEKYIALAISNLLTKKLQSYGAYVAQTRTGDVYPTLAERVQLAKNIGAQIFVSVHCNGGTSTSTGTETWVHDNASALTNKLAGYVQTKMVASLGKANRGVKKAPSQRNNNDNIYVLDPVNIGSVWAVLPEPLFISNPTEENLLMSSTTQQKIADAIAAGIFQFVAEQPL